MHNRGHLQHDVVAARSGGARRDVHAIRALPVRADEHVVDVHWMAYYVAFLTQERVIVGAETFPRITVYECALRQHADQVVHVSTRRWGAASPVGPGYYVCHDTPR